MLPKTAVDTRNAIRNPGSQTGSAPLYDPERPGKTAIYVGPPDTELRFSRRQSNESADGIHRLAKPQVSRYESPQDERNDPAATLYSVLRGDDTTDAQQRWKPGRRLASHAGLLAWSGEHGKILDPSRFQNLQDAVSGGEHVVTPALDQPGRLYKLTKPGLYGAQAEDAGKYLQRWALANRVLDDDVRFEGMVLLPGEDDYRAVISQREIEGRDATEAEQKDYLTSKGFHEEEGRWIHPTLGISIWDTITPGNVIVRPDGSMQAVDLQIGPAKAEDLEAVRNRTGIGKPTAFSKGPSSLPDATRAALRSPEHLIRVEAWSDRATDSWRTKPRIVVHDRAASISDRALRQSAVNAGDVQAFYNSADQSIHILADQVATAADAERIIRHEGMHWVFDGPMRQEYLDILDRVAKSIPEARIREISAQYQNQGPKVWLEEYLAQEGQNAPKSPAWRQFVYEVKRLLRRAFGDAVEFSDADVIAFLSKAGATLEGRRGPGRGAQEIREESFSRIQQERSTLLGRIDRTNPQSAAAEILKERLRELNVQLEVIQPQANPAIGESDDLRFAKTPKRGSWSEVRNGDKWNSVKSLFPKEQNVAPIFDSRGTKDEVVARAAKFLKENSVVRDRKGRMVYLPYGQSMGSYGDPVLNRAEHITGADERPGAHLRVLDYEKAQWLAAVPETIRNAPVRVTDGNEVLYFRTYGRITHQVTTGAEGVVINQTAYDSGLVTQFPRDLSKKRFGDDAKVELLPAPRDSE